jgi:hypothetical protein
LGQSLTLTMSTTGQVSTATLDDLPIPFPVGTRNVTPSSPGIVKAIGKVSGPGGDWTCETSYIVNPLAPVRILVLDLKSGWWANNGGQFYDSLLRRITAESSNVFFDYHWISYRYPSGPVVGISAQFPLQSGRGPNPTPFDPGSFPLHPWTSYDEIWVLSGGTIAQDDLPVDDPLFKAILSGIQANQGNVFLGSGGGYIVHANAVLGALSLPSLFVSHFSTPLEFFVLPGANVSVATYLAPGQSLTSHALFQNIDRLADVISVNGPKAAYTIPSDYLPSLTSEFQGIATNSSGEMAIASGVSQGRRLVLDAGIGRFYATANATEAGTYSYLKNLIKYLHGKGDL